MMGSNTLTVQQNISLNRLSLCVKTSVRCIQSSRPLINAACNPTPEKVAYHGSVALTPLTTSNIHAHNTHTAISLMEK